MNHIFGSEDTQEIGLHHAALGITVDIGAHQKVIIEKLYGPWTVYSVRVSLDWDSACWVIEQEIEDDGKMAWVERARFMGWSPEVPYE